MGGGGVAARTDRAHRATYRAARPSGFPQLIALSLVIASAAYGCEPALWSGNDHRAIYASTLEALGEAVGTDALVIDPAPTFLVEDETGVFRMGDRNRFGDPALSGAIEDLPETEPCRVEAPDEGCSAENRRFAVVSEALPGYGGTPRSSRPTSTWTPGPWGTVSCGSGGDTAGGA